MVGNEYNFGVICPDYNDLLLEFLQSIDTSNLVNGKPVYYFVNQSNIMVNPDAYPEVGYLGFVNCVNVTVQGMNLTNNGQGLLLAFTNESEITGNNASNNYYGFYLYSTFNCTFSGNDVTASDEFGIELDFSSNNTIYHNDFINNTSQVYSSDSTNVWDNGSVGNYWSDYLTNYPNATQVDSSGVWNTSYVIDANNTDHYPLTVPYATVPEFPSFLILPFFMIATLIGVVFYKKKARALPVLVPALNLYFKLGFIPEAYLRKEWWGVDFLKMSKWL